VCWMAYQRGEGVKGLLAGQSEAQELHCPQLMVEWLPIMAMAWSKGEMLTGAGSERSCPPGEIPGSQTPILCQSDSINAEFG
jgi:hypothetical protein